MSDKDYFEQRVIDTTVGFGKVEFSFMKKKVKKTEENLFLFSYVKENNTLDIISLNTPAIISIDDINSILCKKDSKKILKVEINKIMEYLIESYIDNYSFSEENNIPIDNLNGIYSQKLYDHFKQLDKYLKAFIEVNKTQMCRYEGYNIIKEIYKILTDLINKLAPIQLDGALI